MDEIFIVKIEEAIRTILHKRPSECGMLDYKREPYNLQSKKGCHDFVHDVVAMLNSKEHIGEDKYLVFGVVDKTKFPRGLAGEMPDDSTYQPFAKSAIQPSPHIVTGTVEHEGKQFGYICISKNNTDYPYEVAKPFFFHDEKGRLHFISPGQAFMRLGSTTAVMLPNDRRILESTQISTYALTSNSPVDLQSTIAGLPTFLAAAMVGSWNEKSDGDKKTIEAFVGEDYASWIQKLQQEVASGNKDIIHIQNTWKIKDRDGIILSGKSSIFDGHIDLLKDVIVGVLSKPSPKYELPLEQRSMSQIYGKVDEHSREIKNGLSELLAILNYNSEAFDHCSIGKVEVICKLTVREILSNSNWKVYQSIGWDLCLLAQAAPDEFIDSIGKNDDSIQALFHEDEDGLFNLKCGSSIFQALQTIAWDKTYAGQSCLCLAAIGVYEDRAIDALVEILLPWHPQTTASQETRVAIAEEAIKLLGTKAWKLMKQLLPGQSTTSRAIDRPQYLIQEFPSEKVLVNEYWQISKAYLHIYLKLEPKNNDQVLFLVDLLDDIPPEMRKDVIHFLTGIASSDISEEEKFIYWDKISDFVGWRLTHPIEDRILSEEDMVALHSLGELFAPSDTIRKSSRLFEQDQWKFLKNADHDYQKARDELHQTQNETIAAIWEEGGIDAIFTLVDFSEQAGLIGYCLAECGVHVSPEDEVTILEWFHGNQTKESLFSSGYINRTLVSCGTAWLEKEIVRKWEPTRQATLYTIFPYQARGRSCHSK